MNHAEIQLLKRKFDMLPSCQIYKDYEITDDTLLEIKPLSKKVGDVYDVDEDFDEGFLTQPKLVEENKTEDTEILDSPFKKDNKTFSTISDKILLEPVKYTQRTKANTMSAFVTSTDGKAQPLTNSILPPQQNSIFNINQQNTPLSAQNYFTTSTNNSMDTTNILQHNNVPLFTQKTIPLQKVEKTEKTATVPAHQSPLQEGQLKQKLTKPRRSKTERMNKLEFSSPKSLPKKKSESPSKAQKGKRKSAQQFSPIQMSSTTPQMKVTSLNVPIQTDLIDVDDVDKNSVIVNDNGTVEAIDIDEINKFNQIEDDRANDLTELLGEEIHTSMIN
ncbi:hypothetical protein EIN_056250 [Entamoeba invadens IP1]|uniref:hypothetical protein n=1 Tax=Entamoeba invadens IP1 TaxID=370355 RepID=UPI0002C3F314|nr:hypothetical protein EIN_056250 [Entamoeba invadens IP1]ELP93250.1 hypothetical protein EIN_056250 [Entamoeba invadens IP1]|eukprot:XP_004260021.1 hypothetical protein EIN_056250 [Entamoeba invadens IP1]